jgi:hypothetical protein
MPLILIFNRTHLTGKLCPEIGMMFGLNSIANFMNKLLAPSFVHILGGGSVQLFKILKIIQVILDAMWKYSEVMNQVYTYN